MRLAAGVAAIVLLGLIAAGFVLDVFSPEAGMHLLVWPLLMLFSWDLWRGLRRRRDYRAFAEAQGLRFLGATPSDGRPPYTRIGWVKRGVVLWNVIEGTWDGSSIRLFDVPRGRGMASWTTALVSASGELRRGPAAAAVAATWPTARVEIDHDLLCVTLERQLGARRLASFLTFAVALAKAMEQDAQREGEGG